jgi:thioredoxin
MATEERKLVELADDSCEREVKGEGWRLVEFYSQWCPHCRAFRPTLERVASEYTGPVGFYAADVEHCREAAERLGIMSIPTLVLLRDGEQVEMHVGGMGASELVEWLKEKTGD